MTPEAVQPLPDTSLFRRRTADGRRRLLIVDDDRLSRRLALAILAAADYELLEASDGAEALAIIHRLATERLALDCMVLDICMPVLDGIGLLDQLAAEGLVVPTVAVSAAGDRDTLIALMRLGCSEFLDKPFAPEQLTARVHGFIARNERTAARRNQREDKLQAEGVRLRHESDRIQRDARVSSESLSRLHAQVESARTVYEDLIGLPGATPGLQISWRNQPLAAMGGDFLGCRGNLILVADVAGHDLGASLLGVMVKAFFEENHRLGLTGAEFLGRLNHQLIEGAQGRRLVTAVLLAFDPARMEVEVVCAGHPAPIVLRADPAADPAPLPGAGSILGMDAQAVFKPVRFSVKSGDRILLCTDGVTDASRIGPDGRRRRFGLDGLREAARNAARLPDLVEAAWQAALGHCRHKTGDDMLLVGIEIEPVESSDYEPQTLTDDASATERRAVPITTAG